MTTYADLLATTAEQIRIGAGQLRTDTFWSADDARDAIGDFHAVLDAIASHTRRLLWPAQIDRIGLTTHREGLPASERAAVALAAGIESLTGEARPHPSQLAPATTPWRRAALHLRAASDLVATHFRPDGHPRTPDAGRADTRAFDAGLAKLGHLAASVLASEEPLALRALQAGVSTSVITKHLPGLGHLAELARATGAGDATFDVDARARLEALGQTLTQIRTDDPVTELDDRMHRLHQATWDMASGPGDVLATLRDVTTIGIAVHAHAAAFHGAQPTTAPDPALCARGAEALVLRGRAWQTLHRELAHFVTLAPPHATVRDDLLALSHLLPPLAPLDARSSTATFADPIARRIGASLNGAVATMTDIGEHSATAFADLARSGTLHLNARNLRRELVTEDPDLAQARLRRALVRPPAAAIDAIFAGYDIVRDHPIDPISSTANTSPVLALAEREVAAITRVALPH